MNKCVYNLYSYMNAGGYFVRWTIGYLHVSIITRVHRLYTWMRWNSILLRFERIILMCRINITGIQHSGSRTYAILGLLGMPHSSNKNTRDLFISSLWQVKLNLKKIVSLWNISLLNYLQYLIEFKYFIPI